MQQVFCRLLSSLRTGPYVGKWAKGCYIDPFQISDPKTIGLLSMHGDLAIVAKRPKQDSFWAMLSRVNSGLSGLAG